MQEFGCDVSVRNDAHCEGFFVVQMPTAEGTEWERGTMPFPSLETASGMRKYLKRMNENLQ